MFLFCKIREGLTFSMVKYGLYLGMYFVFNEVVMNDY